ASVRSGPVADLDELLGGREAAAPLAGRRRREPAPAPAPGLGGRRGPGSRPDRYRRGRRLSGTAAMTGAEPGLPATMRAAYARTRGGPEAITVGALPIPTPGPGEVLVQVAASPVNHVDRLVLSGDYDTAWADPMVIGRDAVGTVAAAAPGTGFAEGEQVWTASMGYDGRTGTAAQYVAVPAARLYRLPRGIDPITAAATIHPAMTAWLGLVREGAIAAGQTVVIEGAGGAVGSAAHQLAVAAGADKVVTCSADAT